MNDNKINLNLQRGGIILTYDELDECVRNNACQISNADENDTIDATANSIIEATTNEAKSNIANGTLTQQAQGNLGKYRKENDTQILHVYLAQTEKRDFEKICYERRISMSKQTAQLISNFLKRQKKKQSS